MLSEDPSFCGPPRHYRHVLAGSDAEKHLNDPMVIAKLQEVAKVGKTEFGWLHP